MFLNKKENNCKIYVIFCFIFYKNDEIMKYDGKT